MRVRTNLLASALVVLTASCSPCRRGDDASGGAAPSPSGSATGSTARCALVGEPQRWGATDASANDESPVAFGAEIGGVAADESGFVLGARAAGLSARAEVLRVGLDGALRSVSLLPQTKGPANAPLIASGPAGVVVAALAPSDDTWLLQLSQLARSSDSLSPLGELPQAKDESAVTAILPLAGGALVAWDDADEGRGRVRARVLPSDAHPAKPETDAGASGAPTDVVSPSTADASWPVLVALPDASRAVLLWIAERPEPEDSRDGGAGEPTQAEAYRWIEAVVLDTKTARPLGPVRALTPATGHAQVFAATWTDAGLLVVLRDDPRPTEGDGGSLHAVLAAVEPTGVAAPATREIVPTDVAPGVPALLPRPGGALVSYLGLDGTAHLAPAFAAGEPSVEPALRDRTVLAVHGDRVLATRLLGRAVELAVARCGT